MQNRTGRNQFKMLTFNSSYGFAHIGRVGSVFMTLSVTVERFMAISYPLKEIRLKRPLIVASVLGAVVYNVPRFFEWTRVAVQREDPETGKNYTVRRRFPFSSFLPDVKVV